MTTWCMFVVTFLIAVPQIMFVNSLDDSSGSFIRNERTNLESSRSLQHDEEGVHHSASADMYQQMLARLRPQSDCPSARRHRRHIDDFSRTSVKPSNFQKQNDIINNEYSTYAKRMIEYGNNPKMRIEVFIMPIPNEQYRMCPSHAHPMIVPLGQWSEGVRSRESQSYITICVLVIPEDRDPNDYTFVPYAMKYYPKGFVDYPDKTTVQYLTPKSPVNYISNLGPYFPRLLDHSYSGKNNFIPNFQYNVHERPSKVYQQGESFSRRSELMSPSFDYLEQLYQIRHPHSTSSPKDTVGIDVFSSTEHSSIPDRFIKPVPRDTYSFPYKDSLIQPMGFRYKHSSEFSPFSADAISPSNVNYKYYLPSTLDATRYQDYDAAVIDGSSKEVANLRHGHAPYISKHDEPLYLSVSNKQDSYT